ncbi:OstA-like protein [Desulfonauticus submarinus]|uniref:OstA-like protein n=1 Tax=Desulfonauticus submarinus TaxID=206665 RepID=A0A1G9ZM56_9BACT|nr:lipopolysaccharide transport periplasmic protein LptA [Desulfonauticus submarinus]SDN22449.1 OstA-like protein [Desulfonauticus submarinus]
MRTICNILMFFLMFQAICWAETNKEPIKIDSDKMVYKKEKNIVEFVGNVHVVQGKLNLWADKIDVYLKGNTNKVSLDLANSAQKQKIEKIIARNNVKIQQEDKFAICGKAVYWPASQKIVLELEPKLRQKKNEIKGEKIVFYLNNSSVEVLGSKKKRVEAIFFQDLKDKKGE